MNELPPPLPAQTPLENQDVYPPTLGSGKLHSYGQTSGHGHTPPRLPAGILGISMQSPAAIRLLGLPRMHMQFWGMQPRGHSTPCWLAEGAALSPNSTNKSFISPPLKKNYPEAQRLLFKPINKTYYSADG